MEPPRYLCLKPDSLPPSFDGVEPFKAVLVIDDDTTPEWTALISRWLVQSGCRYMSAWGTKRHDWHSSVDEANMAMFDYQEIPDNDFVMTTDHEMLQDAFWFTEQCAMHPTLELETTYIMHIAHEEKPAELLETYRSAQEETD